MATPKRYAWLDKPGVSVIIPGSDRCFKTSGTIFRNARDWIVAVRWRGYYDYVKCKDVTPWGNGPKRPCGQGGER